MISVKYLILIIIVAIIFGYLGGFLTCRSQIKVTQPKVTAVPEIVQPITFELKTEIKDDKVFLKWPEDVKVVRVTVWNMGNIGDSEDHKIVFDMVKPESEKEIYFKSPYQIGAVPQDFIDVASEKIEPILVKGDRYIVEARGTREGREEILVAYCNFSY